MTTASDIITRAGRALCYLGRTEVLSAADATDGLACFNEMLQSWSNETLMSYVTLQRNFSLTSGTATYTIGSGGTINSTRPYDIVSAFLRDSNNNDYPITIVSRQQWDNIGQKTQTSQMPDTLFYSSEYPLGVINIFPVPLLTYQVFFNSTLDQVEYSLLTSTLSLPVGYELAYILNLALQMISFGFPCLLGDREYQRLIDNASSAKANLKRANTKLIVAEYDPAIVARSDASYNIYSDSYPRVS